MGVFVGYCLLWFVVYVVSLHGTDGFAIAWCVLRNFALWFVARVWFLVVTSCLPVVGYFGGGVLRVVACILFCVLLLHLGFVFKAATGCGFWVLGFALVGGFGVTCCYGVVGYVVALIALGVC